MEADDEQGAVAPAGQLAPAISPGLPDCAAAIQPIAFRNEVPDAPLTVEPVPPPRTIERTGERTGERNGERHNGPTYGALDLGTNNCRLLVARPSRRGFLVVDAFSRIIRLGEGVSATGRLSDAAMHRTIDALKICEAKLRKANVARSRLIATQACRVAENGDEFLDRVRRDVGLEIEVVCRETEARLAVSGCAALIDRHCDLVLVFDIGGGSSELIWLDLNRRRDGWRRSIADRIEAQHCIAAWTSLPVGVVTIAERFGGRHVDEDSFEAMVDFVSDLLAPFEREHGFRSRMHNRRVHLLGTSGTVTTVASVHLGLPRYDRQAVDGLVVPAEAMRDIARRLSGMSLAERMTLPCIGDERADLVVAGCAILESILDIWPADRLGVADRGIREGILRALLDSASSRKLG